MLDRDLIYNEAISPEQAVLSLLGLPFLTEGLNPGDIYQVTEENLIRDTDTGATVPEGYYSVSDSNNQLIYLVQYSPETKTTGGKEYTVHAQDFEELILGGNALYVEALNEGRIPGTVTDPKEIHTLFKKGYLKRNLGYPPKTSPHSMPRIAPE